MSFNPELWVKSNSTYLKPSSDLGLLLPESQYIAFGSLYGDAGYGIRDNAGVMQFKNNLGTWSDFGSGGGSGITDGDYGDVTISAGGTVITIDNQAVTRNKLEHIQSGHFLGRHGAGTNDVQEVSPAQARTILSINNVDNTSDLNKPISTATQTALDAKLDDSQKGAANGLAELDATGKVPASQLPAYVDDVVEAANFAALPVTGETGKIYITLDTNVTYRWSGSAYVEISASLALGETSSTAYRGDRGKIAYDHSLDVTTNPHNVTKAQVGLSNVDNTSDANKPVSTATQTALDGKAATSHTHTLANVTDVTMTVADLNSLDDGVDSTLHFHASDRNRANHTGTQTASTISNFASTVRATVLVGLSTATSTAVTAADSILVAIGKLQAQNTAQDTAIGLKANDADVVKLTGAQSVAGEKTFTDKTRVTMSANGVPTENVRLINTGTGEGSGQRLGFSYNTNDVDHAFMEATFDTANSGQTIHIGTGGTVAADGTRKVTVGGNGNVGIGVTTPTEKLDVVGNGKFTGFVTGAINPYDATTWNGSAKFATEDAVRDKIESMGGATTTVSVAQTAHGLVAGNLIRSNGTDGQYAVADKDAGNTADAVGYVTAVADTDNFTYQPLGHYITNNVPTGTAGDALFVGDNGALTTTEPTTAGQISKPVGILISSGSAMVVFNMRGVEITDNTNLIANTLKLTSIADPAAPTGGLLLYSKNVAGRHLPKIIGPSGIDTVLQIGLDGNSVAMFAPANGTTAPTQWGITLTTATTISHQQTIASANPFQATRRTRFTSAATAAASTGCRTAYGQWYLGNAVGFGGFFFRTQFGSSTNINGSQAFVGLCASTAALATTAGAVSALLNSIGVGFDTTDANTGSWNLIRNDGTGTATKVSLGADALRSNTTHGYDLIIHAKPNSSEIFVRIVNLHTGVTVLDTSYTTDIPAVNTALAFKAETNNGAVASAVTLDLAKGYITSDF